MTQAKFLIRKKRALAITKELKRLFPDVKIALRYKNHWQLLVAVVLSAQTTDKKVNEVTKTLFGKYKTIDDYAKANVKQFQMDIKQIGLYRGKARNIIAAAKKFKSEFNGRLPRTADQMMSLPGVGRKSANVILSNAYGIVEGIAVDTHVRRFALKFDLTDSKDPNRIEKDLMSYLPKSEWQNITYRLIEYGRQICPGRKHPCDDHPLSKFYQPAAQRWPRAK